MRASIALLFALGFGFAGSAAWAAQAPRVKVAPGGHHFVTEEGKPFFYLADTAWELLHRLKQEEAELYLQHRARNGFTVVQTVILAELDGLNEPTPDELTPLRDNDPKSPDRRYFRHVDDTVKRANDLGLVMALLPAWGDKWNKRWGVGPEIFTPENARHYGEFLGARYRDRSVIWVLGGDRNPETDEHFGIIRALAEGLEKGMKGEQLIAYHPMGGGNSAAWFHEEEWLDFNMIQSGHGAYNIPNYEKILANRELEPPKPALDAEPRYEDHPVKWKPENGWFDDYDVRQAAYWSMLSGAAGHTYGNHNIWQMFVPPRKPVSSARTPWVEALNQPGALQMKHLRALFESRPWQTLEPKQEVLAGNPGTGADHVRAARARDGSFAFVYSPTGRSVTVHLNQITGPKVRALWFNPREGKAGVFGEYEQKEKQTFDFFSDGRGNDWLLILEDMSKGYPLP